MFRRGRPGRPLLAGALVVGASRSAARREVGMQNQYAAESQRAGERSQREEDERMAIAIERSRREDQERERKTALAIDEAIAKERSRARSPMPMGMPDRGGGYQMPPNGVPYDLHYQSAPPGYLSDEVNGTGMGYTKEMGGRNCTSCGCARTWQDKYCAGCGCKLPTAISIEHETGGVANNWMAPVAEARMA